MDKYRVGYQDLNKTWHYSIVAGLDAAIDLADKFLQDYDAVSIRKIIK